MPKLYRIEIEKQALEALQDRDRSILLGGGKLLNELNIGTKYLTFCFNTVRASEKEADRSAAYTVLSYFLRVLAGHVFEAYIYFQKEVRIDELRKSKSSLLNDAFYADVDTLNRYFGKKNVILEMRRKFSFHTDPQLLRQSFECLAAGFTYETLLGEEYRGHNIFYGSEMVIIDGVQHLKPGTSWDEAIQAVFDDTTRIADTISRVFQRIIGSIMSEQLKITLEDAEQVHAVDGPPIDTVVIPFFCLPPTGRSAI